MKNFLWGQELGTVVKLLLGAPVVPYWTLGSSPSYFASDLVSADVCRQAVADGLKLRLLLHTWGTQMGEFLVPIFSLSWLRLLQAFGELISRWKFFSLSLPLFPGSF